tara:strand:- start:689 stop:1114 length:426 start_codon:yes stop_codon:yes gene_type:complete
MRRDSDRDGVPDRIDRDDDNDGILDRFDRSPRRVVPSSKVVKVRQPFGTSILSFFKGAKLKKKKSGARNAPMQPAIVAAPRRSVVAGARGYAQGPVSVRGEGRDTGTTEPMKPSSRADYVKLPALGRVKAVGRTRFPGDPI